MIKSCQGVHMHILPTNVSLNNNSFQAVNQKYYDKAAKEIKSRGAITINLLYCLTHDILTFKNIAPQDGVDTVRAIKTLYTDKKHPDLNCLNELLGFCKQDAKKERIEERRAQKKGGK